MADARLLRLQVPEDDDRGIVVGAPGSDDIVSAASSTDSSAPVR